MDEVETQAGNISLLGGWLCLDFANTADWRGGEHPREWLKSYADLAAWSRHAGVLTDGETERLLSIAAGWPAEAATVLQRAIGLREAIYRVFSAVVGGGQPNEVDLATVNAALSEALAKVRLVVAENGFAWAWAGGEDALDRMLWPVARSAGELLTSEDLGRVHGCADSCCGWLFLDMSRNRSRQWCSMSSCGNRAKARRHYERKGKRPSCG